MKFVPPTPSCRRCPSQTWPPISPPRRPTSTPSRGLTPCCETTTRKQPPSAGECSAFGHEYVGGGASPGLLAQPAHDEQAVPAALGDAGRDQRVAEVRGQVLIRPRPVHGRVRGQDAAR